MRSWTIEDRFGNIIYFTEERWQHILESRPELESYLDLFLETVRNGRRRQDSLTPNKYQYYRHFNELLPDNNHLIVVVTFKLRLDKYGEPSPNNFVLTGWANYFRPKW